MRALSFIILQRILDFDFSNIDLRISRFQVIDFGDARIEFRIRIKYKIEDKIILFKRKPKQNIITKESIETKLSKYFLFLFMNLL